MILELYDEDVKPEFQALPCRCIRFEHLTEDAQKAVLLVGRSLFYRGKGTNMEIYNAIIPPTL